MEKINDDYSVGYKYYSEEFEGYGDLFLISSLDTIPMNDFEDKLCNGSSVSPNGKYAFFETVSIGWVFRSDTDSTLHDRWEGVLFDLTTASVVMYCRDDCGNEWDSYNLWLQQSRVIFDGSVYNFSQEVSFFKGDLNKDGILDLVIVTQDTTHAKRPYQLEIYFSNESGDMTLMSKTVGAIPEQYSNGRHTPHYGFSSVTIEGGILLIEIELLRGRFVHKFRYQNNEFELIGYTRHESDGQGKIYFTDFNLSTGQRIVEIEYYSSDEPKELKTETLWINPLPNLKTFVPFGDKPY